MLLYNKYKYKINKDYIMVNEKMGLKSYIAGVDATALSEARKKKNKKKKSNRVYGLDASGGPADTSTLGESFLCELLAGNPSAYTASILASVPNQKEEEEEPSAGRNKGGPNKIDMARQMFQALINRPDSTRQNIIQQFEQKINVTHSTAVSYYERLAKEAGLTGSDGDQDIGDGGGMGEDDMVAGGGSDELTPDAEIELGDDIEEEDNDRTGIIRTVDNAHLIYKQQTETGSFEELWIYNIGKGNNELDVKRDILAGTDIPPKKTKSPDGSQSFTITTLGNAQYLHIKGLQN